MTTGDLGFTWRQRKNGDVEVLHRGRLASTLRSNDAADFLAEATGSALIELQPLMARLGFINKGCTYVTSSNCSSLCCGWHATDAASRIRAGYAELK